MRDICICSIRTRLVRINNLALPSKAFAVLLFLPLFYFILFVVLFELLLWHIEFFFFFSFSFLPHILCRVTPGQIEEILYSTSSFLRFPLSIVYSQREVFRINASSCWQLRKVVLINISVHNCRIPKAKRANDGILAGKKITCTVTGTIFTALGLVSNN